jgi:hypothetical protein
VKLDAHVHFFEHDRLEHPRASDDLSALRGNYRPLDLIRLMAAAGFDGCVAVEAWQSLKENGLRFRARQGVRAVSRWNGPARCRSESAPREPVRHRAGSAPLVNHSLMAVRRPPPRPMIRPDRNFVPSSRFVVEFGQCNEARMIVVGGQCGTPFGRAAVAAAAVSELVLEPARARPAQVPP